MFRTLINLCLCASVAAQTPAGDMWSEVATRAPENIDVLVVVRDAAELGKGASGETLTTLLTTIIPPKTTLVAWRALAGELHIPPDEAFRLLLGNRVMFIGRSGKDDRFEWAFESEVDAGVAKKLLSDLGAKPQDIRHHKAIALIENGRYQITSERRSDGATLLFAPTESHALFGELLARMTKNRLPSLADCTGFKAAATRAPADSHAFVFVRSSTAETEWLSISASVDGAMVESNLTAAVCEEDLPKTPFSEAQWKMLSHDRLVAIVEPLKSLDLPMSWLFNHLRKGAIEQLSLPIDGRMALTVAEAPEGGITVGLAVETSDVDRMAMIGDAMVAGIAREIATANRTGVSDESFTTLDGQFPGAARTIALSGRDPDGRAQRNPLSQAELLLTWSYQSTRKAPDRSGWWVLASDRDTHDQTVQALFVPPPWNLGVDEPISYFHMKPRELQGALADAGLLTEATETLSRILSLIESIDGHTAFADGLLRGEITVKLSGVRSR